MPFIIGIGGFIVLCIICYIFIWLKEKANKNVFSASQYERQKAFTNQAMLIETYADFNSISNVLQSAFQPQITTAQAFKGGQYRLLNKYKNKLNYEHMGSLTAYADGDHFECSLSFYQKENKMLIIVQIERWRVSSGVARKSGIDAMENFYNTVKSLLLSLDRQADIRYSGIDKQIALNGFVPFDVNNSKQTEIIISYCPKCGTKNEANGQYCPKCGNKLK